MDAKRIELLREIAPGAKRLGFLNVPTAIPTLDGKTYYPAPPTPSPAEVFGFEAREFLVSRVEDLEPAFEAMLNWGVHVLSVIPHSLTFRERQRIAEFAIRNRIPSAYGLRDYAEAGGLISYAIDRHKTGARSAEYIDRILRGTKPPDLPVDIPTTYELAVNRKTAKALRLTLPRSILVRADWVFE